MTSVTLLRRKHRDLVLTGYNFNYSFWGYNNSKSFTYEYLGTSDICGSLSRDSLSYRSSISFSLSLLHISIVYTYIQGILRVAYANIEAYKVNSGIIVTSSNNYIIMCLLDLKSNDLLKCSQCMLSSLDILDIMMSNIVFACESSFMYLKLLSNLSAEGKLARISIGNDDGRYN